MAKVYQLGNVSHAINISRDEENLIAELREYIPGESGIIIRIRDNLFEAMKHLSCYSLNDLRYEDISELRIFFETKGYYGGAYSQHIYYLERGIIANNDESLFLAEGLDPNKNKYYQRAAVFLILKGITDLTDIDYEMREEYIDYLLNSCCVSEKIVSKYRKVFDNVKIKHSEALAKRLFMKPILKYKDEKMFLLYHPDPDIAKSFWYTQDKEELLFDFTLDAPEKLKHQVFDMLNHVLQERPYRTINERKDRRDRFIAPLNLLYDFCIRTGIDDISQMMESEDMAFISEMEKMGVTLGKRNGQILDNIKKFLFMKAERINWEANIWYMEKMNIDETRNSPASPVIRLKFDYIKDDENRMLAKLFAKYLVGITDLAISNIRTIIYNIAGLLNHCDEFQLSVKDLKEIDLDAYFQIIDYGITIEYYNNKVTDVYKFYEYLLSRGTIEKIPFKPEFYLKKVHPYHKDRIVGDDVIKQMLEHINEFPEHLRLMYFHLLCTGLRVGEVCAIRGDAYFERNNDTWMKVYQNKMASEKVIPIPAALYEMMKEYIKKNDIKPNQFVFQNPSGGVYKIGTFRKQMIICCTEHGIHCNDYIFRPHDYRHTIASELFDSGTSLQSIREFLGHKTEEMTKQYIDYVPNKIDAANEEFFSVADNIITAEVSKKLSLKIRLKDLPNYDPELDRNKKVKYGNRVFNIGKLHSETLRSEFKNFVLYRSTQVTSKSLATDITYYNMICRFLNKMEVNSILDVSWEEWETEFKKWLFKNGFSLIVKRSSPDSLKENTQEHPAIGYFRQVYSFVQPESDINEYDKDTWELSKLGIMLKENKTRPVKTMDFSKIPQQMIREEMKRIAFMELGYKAVASVKQDVASVRRLAVYLNINYPMIKSLTDLNREITEEYLIYINTEAKRGKYQPKDVTLLREIMDLAGRMLDCTKLRTVFLRSDINKKRRTVYKAYSDAELVRLNASIINIDRQVARALTLHQLLGTRISDLLYLKQNCISKQDGKYIITITQHKTGRSYRKPVTEDIKKLIEAASAYTNERFGACEYVFADNKNPDKPMNAGKISYHLRKMIYENDLRDDNGEYFTASTHIFRHNYGKKLVEMHLPDEQIAKLLGHSGVSSVDNYRRMSDETVAKETKGLRDNLDRMLRATTKKEGE